MRPPTASAGGDLAGIEQQQHPVVVAQHIADGGVLADAGPVSAGADQRLVFCVDQEY
jgi:hypothetical protein